jgi:hypothetical protein
MITERLAGAGSTVATASRDRVLRSMNTWVQVQICFLT